MAAAVPVLCAAVLLWCCHGLALRPVRGRVCACWFLQDVQSPPSFLYPVSLLLVLVCPILQFLRFIILLSNMIPISLYVSLEVVKVFQCALLFNQDREMYHA